MQYSHPRRPACHLHLVGQQPRPLPPMTGTQLLVEAAALVATFIQRNLPDVPADDPMRFEAQRIAAQLDRLVG